MYYNDSLDDDQKKAYNIHQDVLFLEHKEGGMDLDQLQVLNMIDKEGSFSKASEKLGRAKSALTYAISNLEDEFGLLLIDRSQYRPVLTNYGRQLLEKAIPLLESFETVKSYAKSLSKNQELKIRLSMAGIFSLSKLTKTLKSLEDKFPNTELVFTTEILSGEKLLLKGEVDISLLAGIENKFDLQYKKIGEVAMPLVISSNHSLSKKEAISNSDLQGFPQIVVRSTFPDERSFGVLKDSKKWYVDDLNTKLVLILEGLGWGRLPEHIVSEYIERQCLNKIKVHESDNEKIEIFLARRKDEYHGIVSNYIWDTLESMT